MKETELNKVLNYMKQYVENKYEHDSEPMLNWKDLQLVLDEIERLNNIINELENYIVEETRKQEYIEVQRIYTDIWYKLKELKGSDKKCIR